jgi:hypothetical protein
LVIDLSGMEPILSGARITGALDKGYPILWISS